MPNVEPDYDAEMKTPPGKTCDDCAHAKRCFAFGFSRPGRGSCDFWPSRFKLRVDPSPTPSATRKERAR
jgi:hypothetical protein